MTRKKLVLTLMAAVWLCLLAPGVGAAQDAFFDEGNQRYQDGDFDGALERYARILDDGLESGELYYNIGNTYFKLNELGPAILYYERARRLMPGDDDLVANLELARSMTADQITLLPEFWLFRAVGWWVGLLPRPALVWLVAVAYLTAMAGGITVILRPSTQLETWGRRVAVTGAAVTMIFGINLTVRELRLGASSRGGGHHGRRGPGAERAVGRHRAGDLRGARRHQGPHRPSFRRLGRDRAGRQHRRLGPGRAAGTHIERPRVRARRLARRDTVVGGTGGAHKIVGTPAWLPGVGVGSESRSTLENWAPFAVGTSGPFGRTPLA